MAELTSGLTLAEALKLQQASAARQAQERQVTAAAQQQADIEAAAAAERNRSRTFGEVAGDTAAAALQSAVGLGGAAYGLANVATVGTLDRVTGMSENFQQTQDIIEGWKSNPLQARKQAMHAAFKDEGVGSGLAYALQNPSLIADLGVQSSAYLLPGIAAARVAGKAAAATTAARLAETGSKASDAVKAATIAAQAGKAATKANLISQAAMTGGYMNVDSVNAARDAGATPGEQQVLGLAGAAAGALFNTAVTKLTGAGALEAAVASRFGGAAVPGAAGGLVRGVATGAAREGTEETLQEGGEQVIRNAAGAKELGTGVATNMALGGLLGVTLGGVMGAANPRRPSQTRAEAAQMQRQVETEIAKMNGTTNAPTVLSPSPLANILTQRENAQYDYAGNPVDLAGGQLGEQGATLNYGETQQVEPTVQQEVSPDQYSLFDETGQPSREDINLDEVGAPLATLVPEVDTLTGARAVIAERNARRASQPPRMDVSEQPVEEVTIDALPQAGVDTGPRNLNDVYRETAPIGGVAQRFGVQVAAAEASRRAGAAPAAAVEPAPLTPIDVSTPKAAKQFGGSVRQALAAATGVDAKFITGADFKELTTQLAASGVTPSSPDFAKKVGVAAAKLAGKREAAGKPANFLGAVVDKYPVTTEDRVDEAFNTVGAPTTEEELFGAAPAAKTPSIKIPFNRKQFDEGTGQVSDVAGEADIIDYSGRKIVLRDINGVKVPFYLSTGNGGKADVAAGKWYPFFGIGKDGWLNKLGGKEINSFYGIPELRAEAARLDAQIGDVRNQAHDKVGATGRHFDFLSQDLLPPTDNGDANTRSNVEASIADVKSRVASGKPTARAQAGPKVQPNPETLLSFLSKRGGVALDEQMDTLGDTGKRANKGYKEGNLFRSGGDGIDSVAIAMHESGYLTDAEFYNTRDNGGVNAARAKIAEAFGGAKVYAEGSAAQAQQFQQALEARIADEEARAADQAAVSPDITGPAYEAYVASPGADVMQPAVEQQASAGSLNPVFDGAIIALDAAETARYATEAAEAARANPAWAYMTDAEKLQYEAHLANVLQSFGYKFHLSNNLPPVQTPMSPDMQRLLSMTEDEYIAAVNPTNKRSDEDDIVIVRAGDLDVPRGATQIAGFTDKTGAAVQVFSDANGSLYAVQNGEVVGQIENRDGETLNIVVQEAQGKGIGTGLAAALIRRDPFAPAGSFSPAGEAARRAAYRVLKAEAVSKLGLTVEQNALGKMYSTESGSRIAVMENAKYAPRQNSITDFVVPESSRGKGAGTDLLRKILTIYPANTVSAAASSPASVAVFYAEGFRPVSNENATLEESIAMMREDSSVTMVMSSKPIKTDTPAFKAWFGNSAVVDADGKPRVVYHKSFADFTEFSKASIGQNDSGYAGAGFYFMPTPLQGYTYGDRTMPVYLSLQNPYVRTATSWNTDPLDPYQWIPANTANYADKKAAAAAWTDMMRAKGYDGFIDNASGNNDGEIVAFEPTQIKSAVGNNGDYDKANPNILFRTVRTSGKSVDAKAFAVAAKRAEAALGIPVVTHEDAAEASAAVGVAIPLNAAGFFSPDGKIHLIRVNNANAKELAFTIAHEAGHYGLAKLLGENLAPAMNRMWANSALRKRIKSTMAQNPGMSRQLAAEEVLADMLASGEKLGTDITSKLYNGVRNFFARLFGFRPKSITNREIDRLLSDVAAVINGFQPTHVVPGGMDADLWLNNTQAAAAANYKFSKVKYDLDAIVEAAKAEPDNQVIPFHHIAKAATEASMDAAKSVWSKVKENRLGSIYMHNFMSLDHLVGWYDKLFGGRLKTLSDLKGGREAQFNRLNAAEQKLKYTTVVDGEKQQVDLGKQSVNDFTEEWDSFKRANPDKALALDYVMSEGTYYQVFPDRAWDDQITEGFDYEGKGYDEVERKAAHARIAKAYQASGAKGQQIYMKSQAVYAARHTEHYKAIIAEATRRGERVKEQAVARGVDVDAVQKRVDASIKRYKDKVATLMGRMTQGPYSPLQRYGDYVLTVRDANGTVVHFSAYDSVAEQQAAAAEIKAARKEAGEDVTVNTSMTRDQAFDAAGVPRAEIDAIRKEVIDLLPASMDDAAMASAVESLTAGLAEIYLQSLPAKSFAKHAISRKNVEGYDTNALRSFANYTMRSARSVAGIEYDGQIANALTAVQTFVDDTAKGAYDTGDGVKAPDTNKLQNVANAVKNQHKESLRLEQNKIVNGLTSAAFVYQMTSISHLVFNATQTPMIAFPRLAGIYGTGRAAKTLNKAMGEYARSGFDLLGDKSVLRDSTDASDQTVFKVLTKIKENGPLDITQAHDLSGVADGTSDQLSPYWGKVMKWASWPMHKSEVFNRQVTANAAVRLELSKMASEGVPVLDENGELTAAASARLVEVGQEAINTTQFNYAKYAKPPVMQGPIGKLVFQYQMYRFHMLSMIGKDIRDAELGKFIRGQAPINKEEAAIARTTLAWVMGMQLAVTGAAGTIIAPFAFALADMFRDDDDLVTSRQAFVNAVGKYAAHGVLAGMLDTTRIEAGGLIPIIGQSAYAPVDGKPGETFAYYVAQNLGPSYGLLKNLYGGTVDMSNGDVVKGLKQLLPKPFADVHMAMYEGANGARDARQIMYYEPNPYDSLVNLVGLRSGDRRQIEEKRSAFYTANTQRFAIRDRNLGRLAIAYSQGDAAGIQSAMDDIQGWNSKYPDLAIGGGEMRRAIVSRYRTQAVADETGLSTSRPLSYSMAGLIE